MNRKYMPDSDFSKWTPLESLAQQMYDWATKGSAMASGSLVKVTTVDGNTDYTVA
jgi:dihydropteridine reductase